MSTNAQSAADWLKNKKPSNEEILKVINKLTARIDEFEGDDSDIEGSLEALDYLQSHLTPVEAAPMASKPDDSQLAVEQGAVAFDSSPLTPIDEHSTELQGEAKQAAFNELRKKLNIRL